MILAFIGVAVFAFVLGFFLGACVIWSYWTRKNIELNARIDKIEATIKSAKDTFLQVNKLKERLDARK